MKIALVLLLIASAIGIPYFGYATRDHWWTRVSHSKVTVDGSVRPEARIYRRQGFLAVCIWEDRDGFGSIRKYGILTTRGEIYDAGYEFYGCGPIAYNRSLPDDLVRIPSVKVPPIDPDLVIGPNRVDFNSLAGKRVVATW